MIIIDLYAEFFIRFFIIMTLIISMLLSVALFIRLKEKDYMFELLILGLLIFSVLWIIHQFSDTLYVTTLLLGNPQGSELVSETFALMGAIMIFSVSIVKKRLKTISLSPRKR